MGKFFISLLTFIFTANTSFAAGFELSDVIKEAREATVTQINSHSEKENIQPVKNEITKAITGENKSESITKEEIIKQAQSQSN